MIPSPCINICKMNTNTSLCQGCYRTLDEKQDILTLVAARRQAATNA